MWAFFAIAVVFSASTVTLVYFLFTVSRFYKSVEMHEVNKSNESSPSTSSEKA